MAELALNNSLINEYIGYKFETKYDNTKVRKLFKYIQPFDIRSNHSDFFSDPSTARQFVDPLANIIPPCSDEDLVQSTVLKLMLVDIFPNPIPTYTTINILNDNEKLKLKYGATYPSTMGVNQEKDKAQKHIKSLLSDAHYVTITDGYVATNKKQWEDNKSLIVDIVPNTNIDLTIVGADKDAKRYVIDQKEKDALKKLLPSLKNVRATQLNKNIHDRYIKTNKLKILLSSGLEHLSSSSEKDFTYVVELV